MIKDCNVLINNEVVTVVRFGDMDVQLPSIHRSAKTVRVYCKDSKYAVVDDNYEEPDILEIEKRPKKQREKKTTTEAREIRYAE